MINWSKVKGIFEGIRKLWGLKNPTPLTDFLLRPDSGIIPPIPSLSHKEVKAARVSADKKASVLQQISLRGLEEDLHYGKFKNYFTWYHWQTTVKGERLNYWPTTGKWSYMGVTYHCDLPLLAEMLEERDAD